MIWNYARLKVCLMGVMSLFTSIGCLVMLDEIIAKRPGIELINSLGIFVSWMMLSIFMVGWGVEPIIFDLKFGKDEDK